MQSCRSLSLSRPTIFNDANIIDNIHQAIINLELKPDKNEIQQLLRESIFYVGNDLNLQEINELYVLKFQTKQMIFTIQYLKILKKVQII